jgi:hypothetical protein
VSLITPRSEPWACTVWRSQEQVLARVLVRAMTAQALRSATLSW